MIKFEQRSRSHYWRHTAITNQTDRVDRIESLLEKLINKIDQIEQKLEKRLDRIDEKLARLDSRFFDFSMRIVNVNATACWSVAIVVLSAAIAFVVSRVSVQ